MTLYLIMTVWFSAWFRVLETLNNYQSKLSDKNRIRIWTHNFGIKCQPPYQLSCSGQNLECFIKYLRVMSAEQKLIKARWCWGPYCQLFTSSHRSLTAHPFFLAPMERQKKKVLLVLDLHSQHILSKILRFSKFPQCLWLSSNVDEYKMCIYSTVVRD